MNDLAKSAATIVLEQDHASSATRFSSQELEVLYGLAYRFYVQARYEDAVECFLLMCALSPTSQRYIKGLAASQFMAGRYADAVGSYSYLLMFAPMDVEALCMCGHALLLRGRLDEAQDCLQHASRLKDGSPEFAARARALLELTRHNHVEV